MTMVRLGELIRGAACVRRREHREWQIGSLMAALMCGLTASLNWLHADVRSKQPDKVLCERAMSAVEQYRFDGANLTLRTTAPQSTWEQTCNRQLGGVTHSWNKAKVTDIGTESKLPQDAHKLRVKFRSGHWVVTAVAPTGHELRVGEDVEVRQEEKLLSIRRNGEIFRIRVICVQRLEFVE